MFEGIPLSEFADRIRFDRSSLSAVRGTAAVVVECRDAQDADLDRDELTDLPVVVIGHRTAAATGGEPCDVAIDDASFADVVLDDDRDVETLLGAIAARPLAAVATALLLRSVHRRSVRDSLVAESATYSMLQSGPEFREWCTRNHRGGSRSLDSQDDVLHVERRTGAGAHPPARPTRDGGGDHLIITLNRPQRRNAYSARMRSALADALDVARLDADVGAVTMRGAGSNFSSGGDLNEFGTFDDPVTAHVSRLSTRVTSALWSLRQRLGTNLICEVHGANVGAGVELAAFAGLVVARRGTTFTLPEVGMGLTPGSGGTASLPLRIGRQRTALLALGGRTLDVETARAWGLVDVIED